MPFLAAGLAIKRACVLARQPLERGSSLLLQPVNDIRAVSKGRIREVDKIWTCDRVSRGTNDTVFQWTILTLQSRAGMRQIYSSLLTRHRRLGAPPIPTLSCDVVQCASTRCFSHPFRTSVCDKCTPINTYLGERFAGHRPRWLLRLRWMHLTTFDHLRFLTTETRPFVSMDGTHLTSRVSPAHMRKTHCVPVKFFRTPLAVHFQDEAENGRFSIVPPSYIPSQWSHTPSSQYGFRIF